MTEAAAKKEVVTTTVVMTDGRTVDFVGKQKMRKEGLKADDGSLAIRIDYINGETRTFPLAPALLADFALHGALSKYGDEVNGLSSSGKDAPTIEDAIEAIDALHDRLFDKGQWNAAREGSGIAGASILVRALVQFSGKTAKEIRAVLEPLTQAQKMALRASPGVREIVRELEDAKAAKKTPTTDVADILAGL
jgi:hypothetical protein